MSPCCRTCSIVRVTPITRMCIGPLGTAPKIFDTRLPAIIFLSSRPHRVLVARHCMGRAGPASCGLPCKQPPGGARTPPSATTSGREELARCSRAASFRTFARDRSPINRRVERREASVPRLRRPRKRSARGRKTPKRKRVHARLRALWRLRACVTGPRRVPRKHPSACRRSAPSFVRENWQARRSPCLARTMMCA